MKYQLSQKSDYQGQVFTLPSLTVPDQTMSIRTILEKYARGENFNQKVPIFSDEDNGGLDIRRLDLSEIAELKNQNNEEIKRMQEELGNKKQQTTIRKPIECAPKASSGGREWAEMTEGFHLEVTRQDVIRC